MTTSHIGGMLICDPLSLAIGEALGTKTIFDPMLSCGVSALFTRNYSTGTLEVGTVITYGVTDPEGTTGATFSWQWYADDVLMSGETNDNYTVVLADIGKQFHVTVSYTSDEGTDRDLISAKTGVVPGLAYLLLLESGDVLLLESGDKLILE